MHSYLVALGSNRWHRTHGAPRRTLKAALREFDRAGLTLIAASRIVASRPVGPSSRTFANAAAVIETALAPRAVLARLLAIEALFGRNRRGQRWGARVLDLDLVLWSGGAWLDRHLTLPHPHYRARAFVLAPSLDVAAGWRDPRTGRTLRQLHARLTRPRGLPKPPAPHPVTGP